MSLLVKASRAGREIVRVTPASAGWRYVGFSAYRLAPGSGPNDALELAFADREICIVVLSGHVSIEAGGERWSAIGSRASVFDDASPYALYAPPGTHVRVSAAGTGHAAEIAVCDAPATGRYPMRLIEPSQVKASVRGHGLNTRYVRDILPQTETAESLLVVEVRTPSGHSSSYPPHKHDNDNVPLESALEETYYHRLNPAQGFAFQRVYTDARDIDESLAVEDHDVVMVPRGYHPVVVPYGYDSYYLNVMAGAKRVWHFKNDPAHEWMIEAR
ncbi:5-deoxy-glucuronate isomerase [Pararobbsia silviterrae]|uniref:5-deoxy-glucuronate isomerase n=1 Tax=Pararobbsia silviterrae TaxID=1792498 RepID=A0A494XJL6_9BURK|nr:5-deoxy-glucuronate isomerase [Pararobbsia silviterrae]RKP47753.1 5-deoxy-glucuronate isomerase [Pararobbsia silviterrae]